MKCKLILIFNILFFTACGVKLNVKGVDDVKVGPNFQKGAEFCDDRYGKGTDKAERCFEDYREYFNVKITFDVSSILDFCEEQNQTQQDIDECVDDILNLFGETNND